MPRKIMHDFELHFISGVNRPAQKPATARYIKGDDAMKTAEEKLALVEKRMTAIQEMTPEQFSFYKGLNGGAAEAFLDGTYASRQDAIAKAESADPVTYTAVDGRVYRKSSGVAADLAKRVDDLEKSAKARDGVEKAARFLALAKSDYANLGDAKFIAPLLEKVDDLPEETKRGVLEILKVQVEKFDAAGRTFGSTQGRSNVENRIDKSGATAAEKIEKATDEIVAKSGGRISKVQAYSELASTPDGQKLLSEYDTERGAAH